jgi:hypothetical protein
MQHDWRTEWPPERLTAVGKADSADYVDPSQPVRIVPSGHGSISARTIIEVGRSFLVESIDEPDDWYMGQRAPDGAIECWESTAISRARYGLCSPVAGRGRRVTLPHTD